jgi:hypothetical protein
MIEAGTVMRDLSLENPIRAIRDVSHDMTRIEGVKSHCPTWARWGGPPVGLARPSFLILIPWSAAYSELLPEGQLSYAWVAPLLMITVTAAVVIAIFCLAVSFSLRNRNVTAVKRDRPCQGSREGQAND